MLPKEKNTWTVSPHAKQRAWERYGVVFSPQKWTDFCNTLQKGTHTIRLEGDGSGGCRFACYFRGKWFLVGCSITESSGVVSTFLPADALSDTEKIILQSDDQYNRIGNDMWDVSSQRLLDGTITERRTRLPEVQISPEELPPDFEQIGELLEKQLSKPRISSLLRSVPE